MSFGPSAAEAAGYSLLPNLDTQMTPISWQLDPAGHPFGDATTALILAERQVPVTVVEDRSLRPKVLDACGMTCTFCHNEGTPVAADNRRTAGTFLGLPGVRDMRAQIEAGVADALSHNALAEADKLRFSNEPVHPDKSSATQGVYLNSTGDSGRVSVFMDTNGVSFVPGKMRPDDKFTSALRIVQAELGLDEMHMTGGEPTLYGDQLPQLIEAARGEGFSVKMTSNGENGARVLSACGEAGLQSVNFSIFGTTPKELAEVQAAKFNSELLAQAKINALHRSIDTAIAAGIGVNANIVMVDPSHGERIRRVIEEFAPQLSVRILNDLGAGHELDSHYMVYKFLAEMGAVPVRTTVTAGSSNARTEYELPNGRRVFFKQIRPTRLPDTCGSCSLNNPDDCKEGYYGVRLYVDTEGDYKVGVCLQRMDLVMPVEDFAGSSLAAEIRQLRAAEKAGLESFYAKHNIAVQSRMNQ